MKPQSILMLCVALCCGLIAMLGVRQVLLKRSGSGERVVQIVRASTDVEAGVPLTDSNVELVAVPESLLPKGVMTKLDDVKERALKSKAQAGEWILANRLGEKGQFGALTNIPAGWAAVTIPVDGTTTHSGMLRPGNLIDLLMTYRDTTSKGDTQKTITVLEFVEVFAVDDQIFGTEKEGMTQARNITLLVKPAQARAVTLAGNVGKLSTVLRKPGSDSANSRSDVVSTEFTNWSGGSNLGSPTAVANADLPPQDLEVADDGLSVAELATAAEKPEVSAAEKPRQRTTPEEEEFEEPAVVAEKQDDEKWTIELHGGDKIRREQISVGKK